MTRYHHVDVFADAAYTGNSLAVFLDPPPLRAGVTEAAYSGYSGR